MDLHPTVEEELYGWLLEGGSKKKLRPGTLVRCIDAVGQGGIPRTESFLKYGEVYTVEKSNQVTVVLMEDKLKTRWGMGRFEVIKPGPNPYFHYPRMLRF